MKFFVFATLLLIGTHSAFCWTPQFQKCAPYKDVSLNWASKNYQEAFETVMPVPTTRALQPGEWIINIRITPSFSTELMFTFTRNHTGNIEGVGVEPIDKSISGQLMDLKEMHPQLELNELGRLLKINHWRKTLQSDSNLEKKVRFLQEFKLPPQPKNLFCLDGVGYEVYLQTESKQKKLFIGCTEGGDDVLQIINDFRDILYGFKKIDYDLLHALRNKEIGKAIELVKQNANPEFFTDDGEGSWPSSVTFGDPELIKMILAKSPDIVGKDKPLLIAATYGRYKIISLLVSSGADINESGRYDDETPLIAASDFINKGLEVIHAKPEDYEIAVKELIKAGANLNRRNDRGETALICAISRRNQAIARDLIEAGADLNAMDNCGNTALIEAAQNGDQIAIEMLLRAGADKKSVNAEGKTAMDYAIEKGFSEIVRLLS